MRGRRAEALSTCEDWHRWVSGVALAAVAEQREALERQGEAAAVADAVAADHAAGAGYTASVYLIINGDGDTYVGQAVYAKTGEAACDTRFRSHMRGGKTKFDKDLAADEAESPGTWALVPLLEVSEVRGKVILQAVADAMENAVWRRGLSCGWSLRNRNAPALRAVHGGTARDASSWSALQQALLAHLAEHGDVIVGSDAHDAQYGRGRALGAAVCALRRRGPTRVDPLRRAWLDALGWDWRVTPDAVMERAAHLRQRNLVADVISFVRRHGRVPDATRGSKTNAAYDAECLLRGRMMNVTRRAAWSESHVAVLDAAWRAATRGSRFPRSLLWKHGVQPRK